MIKPNKQLTDYKISNVTIQNRNNLYMMYSHPMWHLSIPL